MATVSILSTVGSFLTRWNRLFIGGFSGYFSHSESSKSILNDISILICYIRRKYKKGSGTYLMAITMMTDTRMMNVKLPTTEPAKTPVLTPPLGEDEGSIIIMAKS